LKQVYQQCNHAVIDSVVRSELVAASLKVDHGDEFIPDQTVIPASSYGLIDGPLSKAA
jgi:hypothetical protein